MATERSIENDRGVADERAVRSFLEHAAPIILESQVLDGERFEAVCTLADELGLSRDQLACELRLLEQRGVITTAPWDQLDEDQPREQEKKTLPRAVALKQPQPARPAKAVPSSKLPRKPKKETPPSTPSKPAGVPTPPEPVTISTTASAIEALRDRALKLMTRRGVLSPRTRKKLEKAGKQAGLSKPQIASVLDTVVQGAADKGAVDKEAAVKEAGEQDAADRPPVGPSMPPAPDAQRPAAPSPSEAFRRWIDQKLSGYPSSILATDDESGLVGVGVHRYRLAQVLSSHVVREVATDRGVRLERDLDGASCNSTVGTSAQAAADDHKLKEFFEQVAPILTQHRGINAKSRVMMNAVAERLGLTEAELERALVALQQSSGDPDEDDPRQLERRESFRAYLRRAMAQLPNGIITFKTELRLCQAGEHFHGVAPQWIKSTINEVASEIGARFISKQQAIEHVTQLVEDQLSDRPVIDNTTRSRIYTEGTRWGLDPMDVDAILRDRTETLRRQSAADRRRSRWVINFVIGGLAVAGTIVAVMLLLQPLVQEGPTEDSSPKVVEKKPKPISGMAWWDDSLRVALARLRVMRPGLRPALDDLTSQLPSQRGQAYGKLVSQYAQSMPGRNRRDDLQQLLVSLYAREASDSAAQSLASALLADIRSLEEGLPDNRKTVESMFLGCRMAAAMLKHPDTPVLRRNRLKEDLDTATLAKGDLLLDTEGLQRLYEGALAQQLYQHLTDAAADDPDLAAQLYGTIYSSAQSCLDSEVLDRLDVGFLAAVLPAVDDLWDHYGDAIRRAALSSDPNTVIKLLGIYRRSSDDRLKNYLAGLFFERLEAAPGTLTETEMIDGIRESLGVASKERDHRRWSLLASTVEGLLGRKHVDRTNPDVLLQETVELAHAATLACALTRGEAGGPTFDEMHLEGPVKLALTGGPWSTSPAKISPSYPVTEKTVLENSISSLATSNSNTRNASLLRMIANYTDSVPDISLEAGQTLAEYLARFKSDEEEHQQVLTHIQRLGRWNAVRLGLADQLLKVSGREPQLQEMMSELLDTEVELTTSAERDRIRRRLMEQVLGGFSDTPDTEDPQLRVFDEGSKALVDLYSSQAKLLGVPAEAYSSARQPSAVMSALIEHLAPLLSESTLEANDRQLLASLSNRMKAIDSVAENDLQFTAALQQIWLQLLAIHVAGQQPEKAATVREIVDSSNTASQSEPRVFEQMRDVQTDLLRVWMQLRPASEGIELEEMDV